MSSRTQQGSGFKRQVVFRIGTEDWPLLEEAITQFGSIQAAVLAGLRGLASAPDEEGADVEETEKTDAQRPRSVRARKPKARPEPEPVDEEIPAREAAELLGLKSGTVRGYIRSGRLPGRYDREPTWLGWLTTRGAVETYRRRFTSR